MFGAATLVLQKHLLHTELAIITLKCTLHYNVHYVTMYITLMCVHSRACASKVLPHTEIVTGHFITFSYNVPYVNLCSHITLHYNVHYINVCSHITLHYNLHYITMYIN